MPVGGREIPHGEVEVPEHLEHFGLLAGVVARQVLEVEQDPLEVVHRPLGFVGGPRALAARRLYSSDFSVTFPRK